MHTVFSTLRAALQQGFDSCLVLVVLWLRSVLFFAGWPAWLALRGVCCVASWGFSWGFLTAGGSRCAANLVTGQNWQHWICCAHVAWQVAGPADHHHHVTH
jgi:hypothetical protein